MTYQAILMGITLSKAWKKRQCDYITHEINLKVGTHSQKCWYDSHSVGIQ